MTWSWLDARAVGGQVRKDAEERARSRVGLGGWIQPPSFNGPCAPVTEGLQKRECQTCSHVSAHIRRQHQESRKPWRAKV